MCAYLVWVQVGQSASAVSVGWDWSVVDVVLEWASLGLKASQVDRDSNAFSVLSGSESEGSLDSVCLVEDGLVGDVGWVVCDFWGVSKLASGLFWRLSKDGWESNEGEGEELHCECACWLGGCKRVVVVGRKEQAKAGLCK